MRWVQCINWAVLHLIEQRVKIQEKHTALKFKIQKTRYLAGLSK